MKAKEPAVQTGVPWLDALLGYVAKDDSIPDPTPLALTGPAASAMWKASKPLAKHLQNMTEDVFVHFRPGMDPDILGETVRFSTQQNAQAMNRLIQQLYGQPGSLVPGDFEIGLNPIFNQPMEAMSWKKLRDFIETLIHEGMHAAWRSKTAGRAGSPPLPAPGPTRDAVIDWMDPRILDSEMLMIVGGLLDADHAFLTTAARNAAQRRWPRMFVPGSVPGATGRAVERSKVQ